MKTVVSGQWSVVSGRRAMRRRHSLATGHWPLATVLFFLLTANCLLPSFFMNVRRVLRAPPLPSRWRRRVVWLRDVAA